MDSNRLQHLQRIESVASDALTKTLKEVGCPFDFSVYSVADHVDVNEAIHREVLAALFDRIDQEYVERHKSFREQYPHHASLPWTETKANCDKAIGDVLSTEQIQALCVTTHWREGYAPLFCSFRDPPYGTRMDDQTAERLFSEWLQYIGLTPNDAITVINWVGDVVFDWEDGASDVGARSEWSDYFEAGKEWWGIWCLTIWNPAQRTLSVIAASETD
jgi:hypothetical protein